MQSDGDAIDIVSPDGALRFQVRPLDGDNILSFGFPWHTHGTLLAQSSESPKVAAARFIAKLVDNKLIIAVSRVSGTIRDTWITEDPSMDMRNCLSDEHVEFRLWDGTVVSA